MRLTLCVKGSFTNDVIGLGGGSFQIMTADDGERGLTKMTSFFTTIFGLTFASFTIKFR